MNLKYQTGSGNERAMETTTLAILAASARRKNNLKVVNLFGVVKSLSLCVLICFYSIVLVHAQSKAAFRDFSDKGENFRLLKDLKMHADEVTNDGTETFELFGVQCFATKYTVSANLRVQTMSALGAGEVSSYKVVPATFEILISDDSTKIVHDRLVKEVYSNWSKNEIFSGTYYFDFQINEGDYLITLVPDLVNSKGYYFVWFKGKIVKIAFNGFSNKQLGGWGVMDSFNEENARILLSGKELIAFRQPFGTRKEFLKLYSNDFFQHQ